MNKRSVNALRPNTVYCHFSDRQMAKCDGGLLDLHWRRAESGAGRLVGVDHSRTAALGMENSAPKHQIEPRPMISWMAQ